LLVSKHFDSVWGADDIVCDFLLAQYYTVLPQKGTAFFSIHEMYSQAHMKLKKWAWISFIKKFLNGLRMTKIRVKGKETNVGKLLMKD